MTRIVKIFFWLSTIPMMIQISGKSVHLFQKSSINKLNIRKIESFLKSKF